MMQILKEIDQLNNLDLGMTKVKKLIKIRVSPDLNVTVNNIPNNLCEFNYLDY